MRARQQIKINGNVWQHLLMPVCQQLYMYLLYTFMNSSFVRYWDLLCSHNSVEGLFIRCMRGTGGCLCPPQPFTRAVTFTGHCTTAGLLMFPPCP